MKIKATTLLRLVSLGEARVTYRLEIQWTEGESWVDIGTMRMGELEYDLTMSLMALGARRAGVDFTMEDKTAWQSLAQK